VFRHGKHALRL